MYLDESFDSSLPICLGWYLCGLGFPLEYLTSLSWSTSYIWERPSPKLGPLFFSISFLNKSCLTWYLLGDGFAVCPSLTKIYLSGESESERKNFDHFSICILTLRGTEGEPGPSRIKPLVSICSRRLTTIIALNGRPRPIRPSSQR